MTEPKQPTNKKLSDKYYPKGQKRSRYSDSQSSISYCTSQEESERVLKSEKIHSGSVENGTSGFFSRRFKTEDEISLSQTPSELLAKVERREKRQRLAKKDSKTDISLHPTISKLHDMVQKRENRERHRRENKTASQEHVGNVPVTTPSELLAKVNKREARAKSKELHGNGMFDYTTPSQLRNAVSSTTSTRQKLSSSHVHDFVGMESKSPTISEVFDAVRNGKYNPPFLKRYSSNDSRHSDASSHMSIASLLPSPAEVKGMIKHDRQKSSDGDFQASSKHLAVTQSKPCTGEADSNSGFAGRTLGYMHSDVTAYFPTQDESYYGLPSRRHFSDPEFFGSLQDDSLISLCDGESISGIHALKSCENHHSSSSMLNKSKIRIEPQPTSYRPSANLTPNPSFQAISRQGSLQNIESGSFIGQNTPRASSPIKSLLIYPSLQNLSTGSLSPRAISPTKNITTLSNHPSGSYIGQTTPQSSSEFWNSPNPSQHNIDSEQNIGQHTPRHNSQIGDPLSNPASLNQLFWSLYNTDPGVMKGFLDEETQRPSEAALASLHDLYKSSVLYMADDDDTDAEVWEMTCFLVGFVVLTVTSYC